MKPYPAIATIELSDIPTGIQVSDVMIKKAPIARFKSGTISRGRYLILIGGSTASVEESYNEALFAGRENIIDQIFLPDIHPALHDAILDEKKTRCEGEALAILETQTVSSTILATEKALKGTGVDLVEIRLADPLLDGKGIAIFHGPLFDIEAAMALALDVLQRKGSPVSHRIITAPHDGLAEQINLNTRFHAGNSIDLGGEAG